MSTPKTMINECGRNRDGIDWPELPLLMPLCSRTLQTSYWSKCHERTKNCWLSDCLQQTSRAKYTLRISSSDLRSDRIWSKPTVVWKYVVRSTGQKTKNRGNFDRISIGTVTAHTQPTHTTRTHLSAQGVVSSSVKRREEQRTERERERRGEKNRLSSHLIPYWTVHFFSTTDMLKLTQTGLNRYDCDSMFCCRWWSFLSCR